MIYVIDNGEPHSDHAVYYVEAPATFLSWFREVLVPYLRRFREGDMKVGSIEDGPGKTDGDVPDQTAELSLAMAQSIMQSAISSSGVTWMEVARLFFVSPEGSDPWDGLGILPPDPSSGREYGDRLSRMFEGDHDLTVREMGRLLGICGFEPRFDLSPVPGHLMCLPIHVRTTRRGRGSGGSRPTGRKRVKGA